MLTFITATHPLVCKISFSNSFPFRWPRRSCCARGTWGARWLRNGEREIDPRVDSRDCHFFRKRDWFAIWAEHGPIQCHLKRWVWRSVVVVHERNGNGLEAVPTIRSCHTTRDFPPSPNLKIFERINYWVSLLLWEPKEELRTDLLLLINSLRVA